MCAKRPTNSGATVSGSIRISKGKLGPVSKSTSRRAEGIWNLRTPDDPVQRAGAGMHYRNVTMRRAAIAPHANLTLSRVSSFARAISVRCRNNEQRAPRIACAARSGVRVALAPLQQPGVAMTARTACLCDLGACCSSSQANRMAMGELAPRAGFEPATRRLTAVCSTD